MKRSAMGTKCEEMSLSVTLSVIAGVADSMSHRQSYRMSYRVSCSQWIQVGMSNREQQRFFISYFN